jgi:hypothetical protein
MRAAISATGAGGAYRGARVEALTAAGSTLHRIGRLEDSRATLTQALTLAAEMEGGEAAAEAAVTLPWGDEEEDGEGGLSTPRALSLQGAAAAHALACAHADAGDLTAALPLLLRAMRGFESAAARARFSPVALAPAAAAPGAGDAGAAAPRAADALARLAAVLQLLLPPADDVDAALDAATAGHEGTRPPPRRLAAAAAAVAARLDAAGAAAQAADLQARGYSLLVACLGPDHSDVVGAAERLAALHAAAGRWEDAAPLLRRVLSGAEEAQAVRRDAEEAADMTPAARASAVAARPDGPVVRRAARNLAGCLESLGRLEEAGVL